jgi:hypothetical protein
MSNNGQQWEDVTDENSQSGAEVGDGKQRGNKKRLRFQQRLTANEIDEEDEHDDESQNESQFDGNNQGEDTKIRRLKKNRESAK